MLTLPFHSGPAETASAAAILARFAMHSRAVHTLTKWLLRIRSLQGKQDVLFFLTNRGSKSKHIVFGKVSVCRWRYPARVERRVRYASPGVNWRITICDASRSHIFRSRVAYFVYSCLKHYLAPTVASLPSGETGPAGETHSERRRRAESTCQI